VSYVASALARVDGAWFGEDIIIEDVEDLDGVIDLVQTAIGDDAETGVLFVEEDDEWFAVLRIDADGDPRVFISDARVVASSDIAALFGEAAIEATAEEDADDDEGADDDEDDDTSSRIDADPAGDTGLLSDLGTSSARLLELCAAESQLPADVISALCEAAGCLDVLEKLRGE
jgi:putative tRNA adenosine deaminase-associated protein